MYSPQELNRLYRLVHPERSYGSGLQPSPGDYDWCEDTSNGSFSYHTVGADIRHDTPKTETWEGGCFACWSRIPQEFYMTEMRYENPLIHLEIPDGADDFLASGWDTVLRAPFGDNLPVFADLVDQEEIVFKDVPNRSLMEASLYFRLVRAFNECLTFVSTASILRDRYPSASAPVLLAMNAFTPVTEKGVGGRWHPASPNCTILGGLNLQYCIGMLRNWMWAEEQGGWDVAQLRTGDDTVGPHTRRYYGHNWWWFGAGPIFSTRIKLGGHLPVEHSRSTIWSPYVYKSNPSKRREDLSWTMLDDLKDVFEEAESDCKDLPITEPYVRDIPLSRFAHAEEAFAHLAESRRNWERIRHV